MNLLFILLSFFFNTVTPSNINNQGSTGNHHESGKNSKSIGGEKIRSGSGDYIIANDTHP
jgi:hypothetical protein